ncbi:hypothetical protein N9N67_05350 [Bacteriovoracaceae bacterium]|nr:hypothetical protein [Bacteriovoracaceae bacterium]
MKWFQEVNNITTSNEQILSFEDYMNIFEEHSPRELRTNSLYLIDMFNYYGKNDKGNFTFFEKEHPDSNPVYGQKEAQNDIYQYLVNFSEEGFNNKFILLVGPNGSSKSSIIKKLVKCAEEYSVKDEGALFTFSWIFPIDNYIKGSVGLSGEGHNSSHNLETYAYLDDQEISAILNSDLKDHPLMLVPVEPRRNLIEKLMEDQPQRLEQVRKTYLYNGDLSKRNKQIFDALLKNYQGDYKKVLKHIRVERYYIDKRHSNSAATIEPQMHVDASLQQVTMDRRLANLPPSLQSLNLFNLHGEIIYANRGILEFSDLLKRPLDSFKYLLTTMETKHINLKGIITELDIFFAGTTNEIHFSAFKQHPDFNSFKGRFNFIRVPYLTDIEDEMKIYSKQINNLKSKIHFEPHALFALCAWSVMTRLRHPQPKNYKNKKLGELAVRLNPLEKALFISEGAIPEAFLSEEMKELKMGKETLFDEFKYDSMYEGKFGISPREVKSIIYDLTSKNDRVTFLNVLDYLNEISEKKNEYDFLNIGAQGDFHNCKKFIFYIETYLLNSFDTEVRESLGLVDNRSYEDYLEKYIIHIKSLLKNEKLKNTVTGKFEDPDSYFIKEVENNLNIKDSPEVFRSHLISKLGAFSLDNPGDKIVYTDVFSDLVKKLKETYRNEQKKIINKVAENIRFYVNEITGDNDKQHSNILLKDQDRKQIQEILVNVKDRFGYSERSAIELLNTLIKKRYDKKS